MHIFPQNDLEITVPDKNNEILLIKCKHELDTLKLRHS